MVEKLPQRRLDLVVADLDDENETAFLDPLNNQVVSLNATASAIWYLCDGTRDVVAIAHEIQDAFPDLEPGMVLADVERTLQALGERGLLV